MKLVAHGMVACFNLGCRQPECVDAKQAQLARRREQVRKRKAQARARELRRYFPTAPLIARLRRFGYDTKKLERWATLNWTTVDTWCIRHGWHPSEVYGGDWFATGEREAA